MKTREDLSFSFLKNDFSKKYDTLTSSAKYTHAQNHL